MISLEPALSRKIRDQRRKRKVGGADRDRTDDLLIANEALSPALSYSPTDGARCAPCPAASKGKGSAIPTTVTMTSRRALRAGAPTGKFPARSQAAIRRPKSVPPVSRSLRTLRMCAGISSRTFGVVLVLRAAIQCDALHESLEVSPDRAVCILSDHERSARGKRVNTLHKPVATSAFATVAATRSREQLEASARVVTMNVSCNVTTLAQ